MNAYLFGKNMKILDRIAIILLVIGGPLLSLSYDTPLLIGGISMFLACMILFIGYRKRMFGRPVG